MKLIVGLGNPGKKYEHTRHNIGFRIVDALKKNPEVAGDKNILLAKPQGFMNNSGKEVLRLKNYYKLENKDIVVIHDEIDLPFGTLRLSKDSSSAGHKGVQSIIDLIGQDFFRTRIGVNNPDNRGRIETDDYVLQKFTAKEETRLIEKIIPGALSEINNFTKTNSTL